MPIAVFNWLSAEHGALPVYLLYSHFSNRYITVNPPTVEVGTSVYLFRPPFDVVSEDQ